MDMSSPAENALAAAARREPSLGEIILKTLNSDKNITDVHCASGEFLRARKAANDWVVLRVGEGDEARPITVTHTQIVALINGIYEDEETAYLYERDGAGNPILDHRQQPKRRKPQWVDQLAIKKSLHPSYTLADVDDAGQIYKQRVRFTIQRQGMGGSIGVMARGLREVPTSIKELGLPIQVDKVASQTSAGLIVVTGPTGSGKSTTIAALLHKYNQTRRSNVVTLEDPVEFEHVPNTCFFNQREVGVDVESFEDGVTDAMRFAIDIIVIGEIRTAETMRAALRAAESGHLVLTTTHAPSTVAAVRKMLAYLDSPSDAIALSNCLVGVFAQALIPDLSDPGKKHMAAEVLPGDIKEVRDAIASGDGKALSSLDDVVRSGRSNDVHPMFNSLRDLVDKGLIHPGRAAALCQSPEDRRAMLDRARAPAASGGGQPGTRPGIAGAARPGEPIRGRN